MSDPYNSSGSNTPPPMQPAVAAPVKPKNDVISGLDVSESWKRKFRLIENAGGPDLPKFRDLSFGERFSVNFNILAFLFGPIYYLIKGLWRQALLFFILAVSIIFLLQLMEFEKASRGAGYAFAALYGMRANISYYKKMVMGDAPWF